MTPAERYLTEANECERMSRFARDHANKALWKRMAERWRKCAALDQRQRAAGRTNSQEGAAERPLQ